MSYFLWRVEGVSETPNAAAWQQGLTLHLLFQSLTTVLVRRAGQTRQYLVLEGCPRCRLDGCDRLCHRMLFAQLVHTALPGLTLVSIPRLVAPTSESRQVVAVPRSTNAQLLDTPFLAQWSEGRLVTTWSRLRAAPQPITVGALLVVGAQGPPPAPVLHAAGWRALSLASFVGRRATASEVPQPVRVGVRAGEELFAALRDPHLLGGAAAALCTTENVDTTTAQQDQVLGAERATLAIGEGS